MKPTLSLLEGFTGLSLDLQSVLAALLKQTGLSSPLFRPFEVLGSSRFKPMWSSHKA